MIEGRAGPCDRGVMRARCRPEPCTDRDRAWVLAATILGSSLAFMPGSVVNVALSAIARVLEESDVPADEARRRARGAVIRIQGSLVVARASDDPPVFVDTLEAARFTRKRFTWS